MEYNLYMLNLSGDDVIPPKRVDKDSSIGAIVGGAVGGGVGHTSGDYCCANHAPQTEQEEEGST